MRRPLLLPLGIAGATAAVALGGSPAGLAFFLLTALLEGLTVALVWATVWGLGRPCERMVAPYGSASESGSARIAARAGAGFALLFLIVQALGWAGLARPIPLYLLVAFGIGATLYGVDLRKSPATAGWSEFLAHPLLAAAVVPATLLLVAASLPPGVLWPFAEQKGYDALIYHLQVPREWFDAGRIVALPHNTYSYMPLHLESLYYAILVARGGPLDGMLACQWLHASLAVATAGLLGLWCRERTGSAIAGGCATLGFLLLPGTLIVGSLAYDEMAMLFLFACAWILASEGHPALAGGLLGTAVGVKFTAAGLVALPTALTLLSPRADGAARSPRWRALAVLALAAALAYLPVLVRNACWIGDPLYPMSTVLRGPAATLTTSEMRWRHAHAPDGTFVERLTRLWPQGIVGPHFDPLWWIVALIAVVAGLAAARTRGGTLQVLAMVVVQAVFWAGFTHTAGRFLLPLAIPLSIGIGLGCAAGGDLLVRPQVRRVPAWVLLAAAIWLGGRELVLFHTESSAVAPGFAAADFVRYIMAPRDVRLPEDLRGERFLLLGEARAFYFPSGTIYNAPFEESLFAHVWRAHHGDAAAILADLADRGVTVLYVDWAEVERLRDTYGMDPEVTRVNLAALAKAGARILAAHSTPDAVFYRIPSR